LLCTSHGYQCQCNSSRNYGTCFDLCDQHNLFAQGYIMLACAMLA
jgi:hypothetical protein